MIIACDFDGTIVEHKYPLIGKLLPNAKETINKLRDNGHKIIIWTCRYIYDDIRSMIDFLDKNEIYYSIVNKNIQSIDFKPEPKIYADIYIDDKNLFIENINWFEIEKYLIKKGYIK